MHVNRKNRITLTVIALVLGALLSAQVGAPHASPFDTEPSDSVIGQSGAAKLNRNADSARLPPQATLPPIWRVPNVHESNGVNGAYCTTAIVLLNPLATPLGKWEIEWLSDTGGSLAFATAGALQPRIRYTMVADDEITAFWSVVDATADLGNFTGWVSVHGDPRLTVSAFEWCRSAAGPGATLVTVNSLPVYPVGATAQFFRAEMPAARTPPTALPEVPR